MTVENIENCVPWLLLIPEHYNRIYRLTKNDIPVKLEIDVNIEISKQPTELVNVIGEIPGTDLPDEVVMIGGHLDSYRNRGFRQCRRSLGRFRSDANSQSDRCRATTYDTNRSMGI